MATRVWDVHQCTLITGAGVGKWRPRWRAVAAADEGSMTLLRHQDTAEACIMFTVTQMMGVAGRYTETDNGEILRAVSGHCYQAVNNF